MSGRMIEISSDDDNTSVRENSGDASPSGRALAMSPRTSTGTPDSQPVKKKSKHDKETGRLRDYNQGHSISMGAPESSGVSGRRVSKAPERPGYQDPGKIDSAVLNQRLSASGSKSKGQPIQCA